MSNSRPSKAAWRALSTLIDSVAKIAAYCGFSRRDLEEAVGRSFETMKLPETDARNDDSLVPEHKAFLGALIALWWNDPDYSDEEGEPIVLPATGQVSIEDLRARLASKYPNAVEAMDTEAIITRLLESKSVEMQDGQYALKAKYFLIVSKDAVFALNQLLYVADYAHTAALNTFDKDARVFQRVAHTPRFDPRKVPLLRTTMEEQGMELLTKIDGMLESHTLDREEGRSEGVQAGVGVYIFVRDDVDTESW